MAQNMAERGAVKGDRIAQGRASPTGRGWGFIIIVSFLDLAGHGKRFRPTDFGFICAGPLPYFPLAR
jgi:hypothetical protein